MDRLRIDKWLWAARFFKTRSLATRACELGRITANGITAKPAREVHLGDNLIIRNDGGEFAIEVLQLSEMRGPAAIAQTLYFESDASKQRRAKLNEERKQLGPLDVWPEGRPNKKDRRQINRARGR